MIKFDQSDTTGAAKLTPLDQVGWLSHESESLQRWVAEVGSWRIYEPNESVYGATDRSDGIYGLGSGTLEIKFPLVGAEPIFLHLAEVGFWIGDLAELAEIPRLVSLSAASRCHLLHVSSPRIQKLLSDSPDYWRAFYRMTATNMKVTLQHYSEALALTVRARVCRHLLRLNASPHSIEVTQDDFARLIGVTRGTVRRCLTQLARTGAISLKYRGLQILDCQTLERYKDEQ